MKKTIKISFSILCVLSLCMLTACKGKESKAEAPKADAPKAEAPKAEAPKAEAPKAEAPKADAPKADASKSAIFFVSPKASTKVKSPVKVVFGLSGKKVRPAGEDPSDKTSGHHHLIIDGASIPAGQVVPMDKTHIHFGKGQTETSVKLSSGKHTLTMQFADGAHMSYGKDWSSSIEIEVE
jgi:hypothetical protein